MSPWWFLPSDFRLLVLAMRKLLSNLFRRIRFCLHRAGVVAKSPRSRKASQGVGDALSVLGHLLLPKVPPVDFVRCVVWQIPNTNRRIHAKGRHRVFVWLHKNESPRKPRLLLRWYGSDGSVSKRFLTFPVCRDWGIQPLRHPFFRAQDASLSSSE